MAAMTADTPTDAEMIAAVRRLVSQMEGRKLYLEAEHQAASIHVYQADFDGLRAVLARLEGLAAPGEWLPIETAPQEDGFVADLWCVHPQQGGMRSTDMYWDRDRHWCDAGGMRLNPGWTATHFKLLPKPPP